MKAKFLGLALCAMSCHSPSIFEDPTATVAEVQQLYQPSEAIARTELNWANAVRLVNRWGQVQVGVPLHLPNRQVSSASGHFREYLILSSSGEEEFVVQIVGDKSWESALKNYDRLNPTGFTGKILKRDVKSEVSTGYTFKDGKVVGKIFGNATAVKSARSSDVECWEIVLITYYTDGSTTREHLYYICTEGQVEEEESGDTGGGSGSSGETGSCTFDPDTFYASSQFDGETAVYGDELVRRRAYSWKAVSGPTYSIYSHELGEHRRTSASAPWKWHSLSHQSLSVTGFYPGVSINPTLNSAISTLGEYYANMSLSINVGYAFICAGTNMNVARNFSTNINFYVG
jgi:hypothetical protein